MGKYRQEYARAYCRAMERGLLWLERHGSHADDMLRGMLAPNGISYEGRDMPGSPNAYGDAIPDGLARIEEERAKERGLRIERELAASRFRQDLMSLPLEVDNGCLWARYVRHQDVTRCCREYGREDTWWYEREADELDALYEIMPHTWRQQVPNAME